METRAVSIRELIADQVKDENGATLPKTLDQGEISWFTANPGEGKGRLLQIDRAPQLVAGNIRVARNFSCGQYIVLCGAMLNTTFITFPFGTDSSPLYLGAVVAGTCLTNDYASCSGQSNGWGGSGYTYVWTSNDTLIATISGSSTAATATFHGAGSGQGSATGRISSHYCNGDAGGTPQVEPTVTINGPSGVPVGNSDSYSITVSPNSNTVPITLSLTTTQGSGSAQFDNGTSSMTVTTTKNVTVKGVSASSTANNIKLAAKTQTSKEDLAQTTLSSVSVSIALRGSGLVSADDAAASSYASSVGSTSLGSVITSGDPTCSEGVELVGTVTPSNYAGSVYLRKNIVSSKGYYMGSTLLSGVAPPVGADDSYPEFLDTGPQSGGSNGKVYDTDAPGAGAVVGYGTYRVRINFQEYAVLKSSANTTPASPMFAWYSRSSCTATPGLEFVSDVSGDNTAGPGTTPTTWNLQ